MAGISMAGCLVRAALQLVEGGHMKEDFKFPLAQTFHQNSSSSSQLSLQTWTMWQQPDCFPCDSPPHPPTPHPPHRSPTFPDAQHHTLLHPPVSSARKNDPWDPTFPPSLLPPPPPPLPPPPPPASQCCTGGRNHMSINTGHSFVIVLVPLFSERGVALVDHCELSGMWHAGTLKI